MTNREFFEKVVAGGMITEEMQIFAVEGIEKLDKKNAQRRSSQSKTAKANAPLKEEIVALMQENAGHVYLASDIAGNFEYSTQKASALLRQLVADEIVNVTEIKVKGKGKQKGYFVGEKED